MKRTLSAACVFALLGGCPEPEYEFPSAIEKVWGEPNPAPPKDEVQTDRILQIVEPVVDLLWVIDNSLSMVDDREALAENFPKFIEPFEDSATDWHVGVVSTDMNLTAHEGKLIQKQGYAWVDHETVNPVQVFTQMTTEMEFSRLGIERGRDAAFAALTEHAEGANFGFRRPGAYLHVTVVTDEDDDSLRDPYGGKAEFVDFMNGATEQHRNSFNSIVALLDTDIEERGDKYIDLTDQLGGVVLNINDGDWSTMLQQLGGLQTPPPTDEFFLSRVPVPETIEVWVTWSGITFAFVPDVDWVWHRERNSIQFVNMPPSGAAVEIEYVVASSQVE